MWGLDDTHVWAGGDNGTVVFYNGANWQVRQSDTVNYVSSLHGTSNDNIFALGGSGEVLHYDGNSWTATEPSGLGANQTMRCIYAVDATTAIVAVASRELAGANFNAFVTLLTYQNGALTGATPRVDLGTGIPDSGCQIVALGGGRYALNASEPSSGGGGVGRLYVWDGNTLEPKLINVGRPSLYAADSTHIFVPAFADVLSWPADSTFQTLTTGQNGTVYAVTGNSAARVFAAARRSGDPASARVHFYDGLGWVSEALPEAGDKTPYAIHALPSGEVFVVGEDGFIYRKGL